MLLCNLREEINDDDDEKNKNCWRQEILAG
jgi:hypothetical protein